jgi:hypothetical protein
MKFKLIRSNKKVELVEKLIDNLDELYEQLTYDVDEKEIICIKSKIKIREEVIKQLGGLI